MSELIGAGLLGVLAGVLLHAAVLDGARREKER